MQVMAMTAVALFFTAAIVGGVAMRHRDLYLSSSEGGRGWPPQWRRPRC
jgi:hypothetical protein